MDDDGKIVLDKKKSFCHTLRKDNNMEVITTHTKVYEYKELSPDSQEKAREWYREGAFDHDWWDVIYEDAKEIGSLMGVEIDKIYFSGFSCQGDGAQFTGHYSYNKGSVEKVKSHAPRAKELHRIAEELYKFQRRFFYTATARITTQGHYSHSGCTCIDAGDQHGDLNSADEIELTKILRDFMDWIYVNLREEYEYLSADEQIEEAITCMGNEYQFTENGRIFT